MSAAPADGGAALRRLLATALGAGWMPIAPGTWGSAVGLLAAGAVLGVQGAWAGLSPGSVPGLLIAAAIVAVVGIVIGQSAERDFGRKDPGPFVLDEVAGQLVALVVLVPGPLPPLWALGAFLLFRLFDVLKPWPCRALEALPGGVGIMADDLMAGVYAAGCLWAVRTLA